MANKLVIAPHLDDEVLGCASILDEDTHVHFCTLDESYSYGNPENRIGPAEKYIEATQVSELFGHTYTCNTQSYVNLLTLFDAKEDLEKIINKIEPEYIFIHCKGFNQDHNTAYDAAMVALRPHDTNFFVKKVFVYESVEDIAWPPVPTDINYYTHLDIDKKIKGYNLYKSQVRPYRSASLLLNLARVRGQASQLDFAEGFKILRWVE